jgi:hypothetical protein
MNKISYMVFILGISVIGLSLSGCNNSTETFSNIDQTAVCQVDDWGLNRTMQCKAGQKIAFLPNSWGNEQLPLKFIAVNCDLRYSVSINNGGVVCIYNHINPVMDAPAKS